jgi:hypothetical protein
MSSLKPAADIMVPSWPFALTSTVAPMPMLTPLILAMKAAGLGAYCADADEDGLGGGTRVADIDVVTSRRQIAPAPAPTAMLSLPVVLRLRALFPVAVLLLPVVLLLRAAAWREAGTRHRGRSTARVPARASPPSRRAMKSRRAAPAT